MKNRLFHGTGVLFFFPPEGLGAVLRPAKDESHRNNQNSGRSRKEFREHLMQSSVEVWGSEET